jgi:hypothetical protein
VPEPPQGCEGRAGERMFRARERSNRDDFWKVIVTDLQAHGREDMQLFDDEASALDWLASQ